jgi:hypothetical protein
MKHLPCTRPVSDLKSPLHAIERVHYTYVAWWQAFQIAKDGVLIWNPPFHDLSINQRGKCHDEEAANAHPVMHDLLVLQGMSSKR